MSNRDDYTEIQAIVDARVKALVPAIIAAGAASSGMRKLRLDPTNPTEDADELFALLKGTPKITAGDDLAVLILPGGKKLILGPTQNEAQTEITYDLPIVGEKGFNSPHSFMANQNSADVSSSTDTSNYVTTLTTDLVLPTGTWTVRAITSQMLSHSVSGNVVRAQTRIGGTAGTNLSAAVPIDPIRSTFVTQSVRTGQSGTVAVDAQYRPNASGTAYSGGGTIFCIAFRTS